MWLEEKAQKVGVGVGTAPLELKGIKEMCWHHLFLET